MLIQPCEILFPTIEYFQFVIYFVRVYIVEERKWVRNLHLLRRVYDHFFIQIERAFLPLGDYWILRLARDSFFSWELLWFERITELTELWVRCLDIWSWISVWAKVKMPWLVRTGNIWKIRWMPLLKLSRKSRLLSKGFIKPAIINPLFPFPLKNYVVNQLFNCFITARHRRVFHLMIGWKYIISNKVFRKNLILRFHLISHSFWSFGGK